MNVYIIDQELYRENKYQIMVKKGSGFFHVFPGVLFTLSDAKETCKKNGYTIEGIGNIWKCL